ncbi:hypothetical protein F3Y22_tig00116959pilonHSYRG00372 [Hibiscus syriacus]|uniref:Uncharacterized protein n=1 Tax=Hibiscus syriacus TaxID=106335 RepID=A0A6A2XD34_HIBSY|nr:hypothetical protein F3Y22_tig00116959pilonHSYRG00372 [Hibiscus syriacus]
MIFQVRPVRFEVAGTSDENNQARKKYDEDQHADKIPAPMIGIESSMATELIAPMTLLLNAIILTLESLEVDKSEAPMWVLF